MAWTTSVVLSFAICVCLDAKHASASVDSTLSHIKGITTRSSPPPSLALLLLSGARLVPRSLRDFASAPRSRSRVLGAAAGFGTASQSKAKHSVPDVVRNKPKDPLFFLKWANEFSTTNLGICEFDGIRGVSASDEVQAGQALLKIPPEFALEINSLTRSPQWCDEEVWKKSRWDAKLAMTLLRLVEAKEGAREGLSPQSKAWLEQLPQTFDTPIYNSDVLAGLHMMKYTALIKAVDIQREAWNKARTQARSVGIAEDHFDWAMSVVRSRAFSGNYRRSTFIDSLKQTFLATTVANAYAIYSSWSGNADGIDFAFNGFLAFLVYILFSEIVVGPLFIAPRLKQFVLCPIIDMFNHDSKQSGSEIARDYFSNELVLRLDPQVGTIKRGSEMKISYGPRTNDNLLQYYGFVEANNPHDIYKVDFPSFVGRMNKVRGIPNDDTAKKQAAMIIAEAELEFDLDEQSAIAFTVEGVDDIGKRLARLLVNPELAQEHSGKLRLDGDAEKEVDSVLIEVAKDAKEDLMQGISKLSDIRDKSASQVLQAFAAEKLRVLSASIAALR